MNIYLAEIKFDSKGESVIYRLVNADNTEQASEKAHKFYDNRPNIIVPKSIIITEPLK